MFLVAVVRWDRPAAEELAFLAPLLKTTAYDLRLRLLGPLPVVVTRGLTEPAAEELCGALRVRGHGAVCCDPGQVHHPDEGAAPRDFAFEPDALVLSGPRPVRLPYADILAMVQALRILEEQSTTITTKRKLSLGRAALTGGLKATKVKATQRQVTDEDREQTLYLFPRSAGAPWLLRESLLRYSGLGELMAATSDQNFGALVAVLRQRAPAALFDDRLVTRPLKPGGVASSGTSKDQVISQSNASELDLAVHLVVLGHQQGQQ